MKKIVRGLLFTTCLLGLPLAAGAQDGAGVRAELTRVVGIAGQKVVSLAEAMPEESYSWRPGDGVRSVSEVYMHVAGTNYWFPTLVGGTPPESSGVTADYNSAARLEGVTDKATVVRTLRESFRFLEDFVRAAPADRLEEAVNMFGEQTTYRGVLVEMTVHLHEHLGQSIAYARTNGVVPPWSG